MKNIPIHEKSEIADLLGEILEKEGEIRITTTEDGPCMGNLANVTSRRQISRAGLLELLRVAVDMMRQERGEPSRAEEFAAFVESDRRHADAPPVEIGPGACCSCGSNFPLELTRPFIGRVCWVTGKLAFPLPPEKQFPNPGEIGRCRDCGKSYTFGPHD